MSGGSRVSAAGLKAGEQIEELRKRRSGFTAPEIVGVPSNTAHGAIQRAIDAGKLFRAKISHKVVRFYGQREWAEAAVAAVNKVAPGRRLPTAPSPRTRAPWAPDAPVHYPTDENGRPLYAYTVCPSPPDPLFTNTHSM